MSRELGWIVSIYTLVLFTFGCGSDAPSPISPSPPQTPAGHVQGRVLRSQTCFDPRSRCGPVALEGAEVRVLEGPATGVTVTTDVGGIYDLELPVGPFRLQWSKSGYETRESTLELIEAGRTIEMPQVVLNPFASGPQWTVTGVVSDGRGMPVPVAEVRIRGFSALRGGTTDTMGRYTVTSNAARTGEPRVEAHKLDGYPTTTVPFNCCDNSTDITVNVRLLRVIRIFVTGPTSVRVGQFLPVTIDVEFDDGSRQTATPRGDQGFTRDPTVAQIGWLFLDPARAGVRGISPGTTTMEFLYWGAGPAGLGIRVDP